MQLLRTKILPAAGKLLVMFLIVMLLVELGLRITDPLGVYALQVNSHISHNAIEAHPTGYRFAEGEMQLMGHTVTINPDSTRYIPDNPETSNCVIAAVGDSLTYGMGVNDADVWVNLVAKAYADDGIRWINTARPSYNVHHALRQVEFYSVDGYIYLHFGNDDHVHSWESRVTHWQAKNPWQLAIHYYWAYLTRESGNGPTTDAKMHDDAIVALAARDDVLIIAFQNDVLWERLPEDTIFIPPPSERISPVDGHPNVVGNREIAESMLAVIDDFVQQACADNAE